MPAQSVAGRSSAFGDLPKWHENVRWRIHIESIDLDGLIATALDDPQAELTGASCAPFLQHIEERSAAKETKTYIPQIMW